MNEHDAQNIQNQVRDETNPQATQAESLELIVARLQGENQALREEVAKPVGNDDLLAALRNGNGKPKLPDPRTVTNEEYFANRDEYIRQYGIRRPTFGLGGR